MSAKHFAIGIPGYTVTRVKSTNRIEVLIDELADDEAAVEISGLYIHRPMHMNQDGEAVTFLDES